MIQKIAKFFILIMMLLLNGCGGDNAYNGTGVITIDVIEDENAPFLSLQENIFRKDSESLLLELTSFRERILGIDKNVTSSDVILMQNTFKRIMQEWKSVESAYIAADYNNTMIDIPQFFDYYHTGKALDVAADIDKALASNLLMENALNKYSSKSITALEYLIFGHTQSNADLIMLMNIDNKRRVDAISIVLERLESLSKIIYDFYENDTKFVDNEEDASNSIVNILIDSSYKLKEWRIGEPSGIANKYKDLPDPERLEYVKSILSTEAIQAILETHQKIMGEQDYQNFGRFASENGAAKVVTDIQTTLYDALIIVNNLDKPLEELITSTSIDPKITTLYTKIKELQTLYFESLIQSLDLTAEIIEADGD